MVRYSRVFRWRDILVEVMMPYSVINSGEAFIVRQTTLTPFLSKAEFRNYHQDDDDYVKLQPDAKWYMVLEITTVNVKEKPKDRELQILMALEKLLKKIDTLNQNVQKLPDKPPEEKPKKYSFGLLVAILASLFGSFIWWVNKSSA